jgi:hypothetical protein
MSFIFLSRFALSPDGMTRQSDIQPRVVTDGSYGSLNSEAPHTCVNQVARSDDTKLMSAGRSI